MNHESAARDALGASHGWRKSSYSQGQNDCVEITSSPGWVGVRDSKLGDASPILTATPAQWHDLIAAVRGGRLTR